MSEEAPSIFADEAITVSTSAVGVTSATAFPTAGPANYAYIECQVAAVRYRLDGTDPTASVGHILNPGDVMELESQDQVANFKAIRKDGADATLHASYGRV